MIRLLLLCCILVFSLNAYSENIVVKVGVWNNPPLSIIKKDRVSGFMPDLFKYIAKKENIEFTFVKDSWENLYEKIQTGEIDVLLPIGYSKRRLSIMKFNKEPAFTNWGQIIVNKNSNIKSLIDLKDKKIAVKKNNIFYVGEHGLTELLNSFDIEFIPVYGVSYPNIVQIVSEGNADAGLISRIYAPYIKDANVIVSNIVLKPINVQFAFSKSFDDRIINNLDNVLIKLKSKKDSYYYELINELFNGLNTNYKSLLKIIYFVIGILFLLLIITIVSRIQVKRKTSELDLMARHTLEVSNKLKTFINAMPDVAFVLDTKGNYIEIFTSSDDLLYDFKENLIGKNFNDVIPGDIADKVMQSIQECMEKKSVVIMEYELEVLGGKRDFEGRISPIGVFDDNEYVLFVAIDVTKHKKLEEELIAEKEKFETTLKSIADAVVVVDKDKKIIFYNNACGRILDKNMNEIVGNYFEDEINLLTDDNKKFIIPFDDVFNNEVSGNIVSGCKLINKNGDEYLIEDSIAPLYGKKNEVFGAVFVFSDVTERKKLEREIIKNQHLESLGRIAGGIAHDFNNYLSAINSYVDICKLNDKKPTDEVINSIDTVIDMARNLTKQLITFSKGGSPVRKPKNIKDIIENTTKFILSGSGVNTNLKFEKNLPNAFIDQDQFAQVISNLIVNAKEATDDDGQIDINVKLINLLKDNIYQLEQGDYLEISIRDYGQGIPNEIQNKIFEPFFTTKSDGNGLGLAISNSIIEQHKGKLSVYSEEGKGTEFRILVKACYEAESKDKVVENKSKSLPEYNYDILYMDDEEFLRNSFKFLLTKIGCRVDLAKNGEEAIELVKKKDYDMIILDLTIKNGLGGKETAKRIFEIKENSYLIVTSGYSDDDVVVNYKKYGFKCHLEKPFRLTNLLDIFKRFSEMD